MALAAFIESLAIAGIIVPGVAILFAFAVVAGSADISLLQTLAAAFTGAVLGDGLSFLLGYHYRDQLRNAWPVSRYPEAIASGEQFFARHGGLSVVIGRFIGPIRPVLPLIAGMLAMSPLRFFAINFTSALAWAPSYILPGYLVGAAIDLPLPEGMSSMLLALASTVVVLALVFRWLNLRLQDQTPDWLESPKASLCLAVLSSLAFVLWTYFNLNSLWLDQLDHDWAALAQALNLPELRDGLVFITMLADERLMQLSFVLVVLALALAKHFQSAMVVAAAGLALSSSTHALKLYFALPRPEVLANALGTLAYPSGHTSAATVLFGVVAALIAQQLPNNKRWPLYLAFSVPVLFIALSRVLLGAHWLSDIVGGWLLGLLVCALARLLDWSLSRYSGQAKYAPKQLSLHWLSMLGGAWLLVATSYIVMHFSTAQALYTLAP